MPSGKAVSVGRARQCRRSVPRHGAPRHQTRRRHRPDLGARSAQRLLCPQAGRWSSGSERKERDPAGTMQAAKRSMRRARARPCSTSSAWASRRSTTATTSARWPRTMGVENAFDFPGFVPAYIRPLFCRGIGPFRWAALVGRSGGHLQALIAQGEGADARRSRICTTGSTWRASASQFQGLPARICWVGLGDRAIAWASPSTRWWRSGELKAPVVIGRDHLDSGSVASPNRETEAMKRRLGRGFRLAAAQRPAQHGVAARPGCRCIMAAASAWAIRSIQAWSSSPTARRKRPSGWNASSGTIPPRASCAMPMPATRSRMDCAREKGLKLPGMGIG